MRCAFKVTIAFRRSLFEPSVFPTRRDGSASLVRARVVLTPVRPFARRRRRRVAAAPFERRVRVSPTPGPARRVAVSTESDRPSPTDRVRPTESAFRSYFIYMMEFVPQYDPPRVSRSTSGRRRSSEDLARRDATRSTSTTELKS